MAGFIPMPLEAELDLAETVAVGRIADIAKEKEWYGGKLVQGRATVTVSEVLKGPKANAIKMTVVMAMDRELAMQSPERVYRQGDKGIWVIMSDGRPSHGYGLLVRDRLEEVKAALKDLDKRRWSQEVNGLKAWAAADMKNLRGRRRAGMVMFAVTNVSKKPIYLPLPFYDGVVNAMARHSSGKAFQLRGIGMSRGPPEPPLTLTSQSPLQPGEIRYLHPDGQNLGYIVIPKDLPSGKYSITVRFANTAAEGHLGSSRNEHPVTLWTGEIAAPVFTVEIPERPPAPKPATRYQTTTCLKPVACAVGIPRLRSGQAPTHRAVSHGNRPDPPPSAENVPSGPPVAGKWKPIAELTDEFEGSRLDPAKWHDTNPSWKGRKPALFRPSNVRVEGGKLHLTMRCEDVPGAPDGYHTFTSAAVKSTRTVLYGYFEARCKPMASRGSSAFWFYNSHDPKWWTEIDVFEIGGGAPKHKRTVHMNVHVFRTPTEKRHWSKAGRHQVAFDLADSYHVYGLEWDKDRIAFYFDGVVVRTLKNTHWHQPLHLNFDSETMPDWFGLPDKKNLPSAFSIEYLRAWKKIADEKDKPQETAEAKDKTK